MKLLFEALIKFLLGIAIIALLLFLPAGTFSYGGGILLLALLFIPMFVFGIVLYVKAPKLLKKRLDIKEKQSAQKGVVLLTAVVFAAGFITAGLDFRYALSDLPYTVAVIFSVILLLGYLMFAEVTRENAYLSRTVKVEEGQKVISHGLYSLVRHPMYLATLLIFLSIPFVLGSCFAVIPFAFYIPILVVRILGEEKLLEKELEGYREYKDKVKYRLIPFVW